ncbi:hypothetical protein [Ulvibacter litoralis]|uniref:hypothetical protein n=1 Tax=Ulvibacter litoralis TaxID=227084 RepID=UPI0011131D44|nr:hypothetical protein [Ulvibacter litoralis]
MVAKDEKIITFLSLTISFIGMYRTNKPRPTKTFLMILKSVSNLPKTREFKIRKRKKEEKKSAGVVVSFFKSDFETTKGNATTNIPNKIFGNTRK